MKARHLVSSERSAVSIFVDGSEKQATVELVDRCLSSRAVRLGRRGGSKSVALQRGNWCSVKCCGEVGCG